MRRVPTTGDGDDDAVAYEGSGAGPASSGALDQDGVDAIMRAVAERISATTYTLLQRMVAQGVLRLIVDDGEILTRLHLRTTGSDFVSSRSTDSQRRAFNARASASTCKLLSKWVNASGSTSYSNVRVRTMTEREASRTNTTVDVYGRVRVNVRTDFAPLADLV